MQFIIAISKEVFKTGGALFFALVIASFSATNSHAGSWNGWIYQNPYPTSNSLSAVRFITPQKGWVAGEQGTILYTENGGDTWAYQESGTDKWIKSLFFVNERQGWAVGGGAGQSEEKGMIIHTNDGGKTWVVQDGDFNSSLNSVYFLNENKGWIAGSQGVLLHTTDAGKSWQRQRISGLIRAIASVHFVNPQTGWLLAGDEIYRTTDGGQKWNKVRLDIRLPRGLEGVQPEWSYGEICFINEKKGWVASGYWHIFLTEDGGKTWIEQFSNRDVSRNLAHIFFSDDKRGCATGSSIVCTEDGGKTWGARIGAHQININDVDPALTGIHFTNQSVGWAVGSGGQIMKTEDSGKSWMTATRDNGCGSQAFFINKKTGWLHRWGALFICRTDDGGQTWQKQDTGIRVNSVFFVNGATGWAVGTIEERTGGHVTKSSAVIIHTKDGGKTWSIQFNKVMSDGKSLSAGLQNVFFLNAQLGWAVGKKGTILNTEDAGKHWMHQRSGDPILQLRGVQFVDSKTGWITGIRSTEVDEWTGIVLHTTDGGHCWQKQYYQKDLGLERLYFTDNKTGWVTGETEGGQFSSLFKTTDGGKTWKEAGSGFAGSIYPAFRNNQGIIISDKGWFLITKDGGINWKVNKLPLFIGPRYFDELFEN